MPAGRVAGKAGYSNHYYNGEFFNSFVLSLDALNTSPLSQPILFE